MWKMGLLVPTLCPSLRPVPLQRPRRAGGVYALTLLTRGLEERWWPGDVSSQRLGAAAAGTASSATTGGEQAPE